MRWPGRARPRDRSRTGEARVHVPETVVSGTTPATPRKLREVVPKTSPETVCRLTGFDPALRTLAVEGSKRYAEVFELIYRRQAPRPNEIWQADHTLLDLWVVTPSGKPGRPWLTVTEDDHSRAIAGYAVNLDAPSALQTALALRHAIWRKSEPGWHVCGIPDAFYTDHGSDFTSPHPE